MTGSRTDPDLAWDTFLDLGEAVGGPLHARLTRALRGAIRDGVLAPGSALPPSRQLAQDLGCSRWVVTESYGQLVAEGYLDARPGAATRVSLAARSAGPPEDARPARTVPPRPTAAPLQLAPGLPDLREFPRARWLRALRTVLNETPFADLGDPDSAGHGRLRAVLAAYLTRVRAATASADTVTITHRTSDGVARLARALAADGVRRVAVEDPGWPRLRAAIRAAGHEVVGVPVDEQGIRVDRLSDDVGAVLLSPAHQFPVGVVLSPDRRARLLAWAERTDGLVIEDDYDAEFRYDRRPVSTLQGMAPDRVVLTGSVSKTLSPALGLGWLVAPARFNALLRAEVAGVPPVLDQLTFAELIESGGYDRHLRGARQRYRARRDALLEALAERLPRCEPSGAAAGLHLLLRLPEGVTGTEVVARARGGGLEVADLHRYRIEPAEDDTLVLGYANLPDTAVHAAVDVLARAVAGEVGASIAAIP